MQRFGDPLNLNVHFHSLVQGGVYARSENGALRFHPLPRPDDTDVERVARQLARRLARLLERRGLADDASAEDDTLATKEPLLASLYAAAVTSRVATGSRSGQRALRMGDRIDADDLPVLQGERCATVRGVSVHANVAVPAHDWRRLERLCRYGARPAIATERLSRLENGRLLYQLEHRWRDGTTHVVFTQSELARKLAAHVPPPRFHLGRYHGVLGPCASERDRIVPAGANARRARSAPRPELDSTPTRVDGDPPCATPSETPGSASIELLASMRERELLATPPPHRGCQRQRAGTARCLEGEAARVGRADQARLRDRRTRVSALSRPDAHPRGDPPARHHVGNPRLPGPPGARSITGAEAADQPSSDFEF